MDRDKTVEIPTHAALTIASGLLIPSPDGAEGAFSDLMKAASDIVGYSLFSHEFAHQALVDALKNRVVEDLPWTAEEFDKPADTDGWIEFSKALHEKYGATVRVKTFSTSEIRQVGDSFGEPLKGKEVVTVDV